MSFPLLLATLFAQAPPPEPPPPGRAMIEDYFRLQVKQIADHCLSDLTTKEDWEKRRPELRRQFLEMIGLWPLPPRTDLHATITGTFDAGPFTVEKLHFQSAPGLYVTANLYVPKPAPTKAPTVLYLCGHGNTVINGVSYGSKVSYKRHPGWFASHGYVCLILDTLELGELPGEHHGTYRLGRWWWQALDYTPAGVEVWNAMRAMDYLETRPEVDPKRIGLTGRSGGGAQSWFVAAADDRPQCIIPVAGIADLWAHVCEGSPGRLHKGVIAGHCDCMFMVNSYRWDFAQVAALCAPRPLLLGNSDADTIFPVPGYRRLAEKVKRVYALYGATDRFQLMETKGPHKDTPELRIGAFRWLNRWLKHDTGPVDDEAPPDIAPAQLKVFGKLPADAVNLQMPDTLIRPAHVELPQSPAVVKEWWPRQREQWQRELAKRVFAGWAKSPPPLNVKPAADVTADGLRLRAFDFISEQAVPLRLWLLTAEKVEKPTLTVLTAVDEKEWQEFLQELGPAFAQAFPAGTKLPQRDAKAFAQTRRALTANKWAFATLAPRGIGPTRWAKPGSVDETQIRRRFPLIGQTQEGQQVWDVRRAVQALHGLGSLKGVPLWLQGHGETAGVVLYAGLFEPEVVRFDLWHPSASHRQGPVFLGVLRVLDMPEAVALARPRPVRIYVKDAAEAKAWEFPRQLQQALGEKSLVIRTGGE